MIFNDTPEDQKMLEDFWINRTVGFNTRIYKSTPDGEINITDNIREQNNEVKEVYHNKKRKLNNHNTRSTKQKV